MTVRLCVLGFFNRAIRCRALVCSVGDTSPSVVCDGRPRLPPQVTRMPPELGILLFNALHARESCDDVCVGEAEAETCITAFDCRVREIMITPGALAPPGSSRIAIHPDRMRGDCFHPKNSLQRVYMFVPQHLARPWQHICGCRRETTRFSVEAACPVSDKVREILQDAHCVPPHWRHKVGI